ncbi:unnamed protein product, partial [Owenia fusiformis]
YNCTDGGTMNENCTLCSCPGNVTFIVRTPEGVPIQGVNAHPVNVAYLTLGVTDANGMLSTSMICPSEPIVFTKHGFADAFDNVGSDTLKNITMHKLGKLFILAEPNDRSRLVGESVTFV